MATTVAEPETTETQQTDPDAKRGFGEIMQERLDKKTQPAETVKETPQPPKPASEPATEPLKPDEPPATTPIGDVLDAALSKEPPKEKAAEAPASPVDEFKDVTVGVTSEKVKERMIKMRGKIETLWNETQTLARERADLQTKVKPALEDPEVQQLIKSKDEELARANQALLALNIDGHPEFQREFTQPREKLARSAAQKLQSYGGNGQALLDALYMPEGIRRDEAVAQLLDNVPDYAKTKITGIVNEIEGLDDKAAEKRANAPKTWEELNARDLQARQKKAEDYRNQVKGVHEAIVNKLSENPFFRQYPEDIKGAADWNNGRNAALERGLNHILGSDNTVERSIEVAIKGERFDDVTNMLSERLTKEWENSEALAKKLAEYEGVQPTVRGVAPPAGKESDDEKDLPFGEIVARRAGRRSEDTD